MNRYAADPPASQFLASGVKIYAFAKDSRRRVTYARNEWRPRPT